MKIWNYLLIASTIFLASGNTFASESKGTDYYPDYYENEGNLLFKLRGFYASASAKNSNLPAPTNAGAASPGALIQNGLGFDTATSFFFTNNFAVELSLGVIYYNVKGSALDAIFTNYGRGTNNNKKKKNIYTIPASATLQYHIAPYGAIRPYVGGGFHGTYMSTQAKQFKIRNGYGAVLQAGVDFIGKDDTVINFDVRQFFLKSRINYKSNFLNTRSDVSSKIKLNPVLISVGVGFKF
jgi:outer membrane protein